MIPGRTTPAPPDPDARLAYIALALVSGIGPRKLAQLLSHYSGPVAALEAATNTPRHMIDPIRPVLALARHATRESAEAECARCADQEIELLTPADAAFPAALRSIPDPPVLLYARGDIALLSRPAVAIIGSRNHTRYGSQIAADVSAAAAGAGIAVVSGMARGLDAIAHRAALDAAGATIGILGNGIGVIYPLANRALYERVEAGGLLLTEHPPGEGPVPGSFPRRNRLISGLARVVVVVEAAEGSGTLVTVACALEQGRDVMAVPGPLTSATSVGTNRLLRDGAEPLLTTADLLAKFQLTGRSVEPAQPVPPPCSLSGDEARAFNAVTADTRHVDELAFSTGLPIGHLLGVLCGLELGGLVEQLPGMLFRRPAQLQG